MYPAVISAETRSEAERRLFARFRDQLSDTWVVMHSVGLTSHSRKPWAEIDFVLIGPAGLFCLEVKGGRVRRDGGRWVFTDGKGNETVKAEGPFDQVGGARAALFRHLRDRLPWVGQVTVGYGVMLPDCRARLEGPDIEPEVLYDCNDGDRPIGEYIDRVAQFWRSRLTERDPNRPPRGLTTGEVRVLVDAVRGDFDLVPSLRAEIRDIAADLVRATEEEAQVLRRLEDNDRLLVTGGAGTGKTLLAVEASRRAAREGQRVLLVCFNRNLGSHLAHLVGDVPGVTARHFHGLLAQIVAEGGLEQRLPDVTQADLFRVFYPELAVEVLLGRDPVEAYDLLVVDEAQDLLLPAYIDVLDLLLKGGLAGGRWRVFYDHRQNLFQGTHPGSLERLRANRTAAYSLTVNCRNTEPIAVITGLLSGIDADEVMNVPGPEVDILWWKDQRDQRRQVSRCVNRLLSAGVAPAQITVLGARRLENSCLGDGLEGVAYPLRPFVETLGSASRPGICYSTIQAFKGLEADVVVVVDVDDLVTPTALASLYVGTSRARARLTVALAEAARTAYEHSAMRYGERLAASGDRL